MAGNFRGRKIGEKYDFRWENFHWLLTFAAPKAAILPNFTQKIFANTHKTAKFTKVFSLESFPLYSIMWPYTCTHLLSCFPVTVSTGAPNEDSPDGPQLEDKESSDIFQADTPAILRQNSRASVVRQSTLQRHNSRNSSVRKTSRPGDISTSQSNLTEPIQSPTHVSINLNLDIAASKCIYQQLFSWTFTCNVIAIGLFWFSMFRSDCTGICWSDQTVSIFIDLTACWSMLSNQSLLIVWPKLNSQLAVCVGFNKNRDGISVS